MGKIRYMFALFMAKISVVALRVTRHNGTNFPGLIACRICPDFLDHIGKPRTIIGVTGTNGKTTVSNLLTDTLTHMGEAVLNNSAGSNTVTGIATSLISNVDLFGRKKKDTAVFEIDERSAKTVFPYLTPNYLIVNNLSRDSIMRNGHPQYIRNIISWYLPKDTHLILNADDMIASSVSPDNERTYFGIDRLPTDKESPDDLICDMRICPNCHKPLTYDYCRYGNIGRVHCENCGLTSPERDYTACDVDTDNMSFNIKTKNGAGDLTLRLLHKSVINLYNEVACVTCLTLIGKSREEIESAMNACEIAKSRYSKDVVAGVSVVSMLSKEKNAYATSRVFELIGEEEGKKALFMFNNCVGDTKHWSENTCWLYDCDFEKIVNNDMLNVFFYGDRGLDLKLRLMMAGYPEDRIVYRKKLDDCVKALNVVPKEKIFVLYGTDSLDVGERTRKLVLEKLRQEALAKEAQK